MKCLETRTTADGFKRRRYQDDGGQRFTTIEVPIEAWNQMQTAALRRKAWHERESLRKQVLGFAKNGWTVEDISIELGISNATVRRWLKEVKTPT